MITLYNTLTRKKEPFEPILDKTVGMYTCGPTVYHNVHIGNLRTYTLSDILRRVLQYNGYEVNYVMNITDVGHLTDDADQGEDKMEKGSRREGKTAWEIAAFYTKSALDDMQALNILPPNVLCKATEHITEQINQVQELIHKGYTYETTDGIYFDTTKLPDYGKLANLDKQQLEAGVRVDMGEKKNPHDFALWKFSASEEKRQMEWPFDTTQGTRMGFPGWHIECSAMSMKYLGDQFDIHCGGIDLIPVHHTNEIAQAEAITNKKPWVKYWIHGEFILLDANKMAKSGGNAITLETIKEKGFSPLAYRFLLLQAHYRKQLNFTWESIHAAQNGYEGLVKDIQHLKFEADHNLATNKIKSAELPLHYIKKFKEFVNNDLGIPDALALTYSLINDENISAQSRLDTILEFDKIFGLRLNDALSNNVIPTEVMKLGDERAVARANKNWFDSDRLRDEISRLGYTIEDTASGQKITKNP